MTITTQEAAILVGISQREFKRIVKKKGLSPVGYHKSNPKYSTEWDTELWDENSIASLLKDPDVVKLRKRGASKIASHPDASNLKPIDTNPEEHGDSDKTLKDVCETLQSLNRHSQSSLCDSNHRIVNTCSKCDGSTFDQYGDHCMACCGSGYSRIYETLIFCLCAIGIEDQ